ncbi:hypothetical protein [Streptomyces rimosus]|uniref:hypothetical protein n=1 Tax=Streptomyces rimosus TaxID=1927 RepID=UPI0004BEEB76|nr:hypothetical protein [Streptomyces rimosus]
MSTMSLNAPVVQSALFPPPSAPLFFTDGDRYVWTHTGDVWTRTNGSWVPSRYDGLNDDQDDGTGWWSDAEVRAALGRAVEKWDARQRFVPADPGPTLPGRTLLAFPPLHDCAQYVTEHQSSGLLVPVRELVAAHDEDAAYDIPGVITAAEAAQVLSGIVAEHDRVRVRYDEAAGRVYVRYSRYDAEGWRNAGLPSLVTCLHVFVLAAAPSEA